jgi:outer membrane protein TolC
VEFLDVLDAQRTLLEARAAVLALERDAALAEADILAVTGDTP